MKKSALCLVVTALLTACSPGTERKEDTPISDIGDLLAGNTLRAVESLAPELDTLIASDAEIEILASGFTWSEGPVWVPSLDAILFSDVPENIVYKWSEVDSLTEYLNPSGYTGEEPEIEGANGLALDAAGNLILCQHGDRRLARMNAPLDTPAVQYETIIAAYEGRRFNSPNDLTLSSGGTIYFTDPPYGLKDEKQKELDFQGVYKLDPKGSLELLVDSLTFPNGIALSPDEQTLYVAVSDPKKARYYAYDVDTNGRITGGRILLDVTAMMGNANPGLPDGLKVHPSGNLFATGPGGVLVITPEGQHIGTIRTGESTANCGFNEDYSVLYMTADMHLMRVRLR